MGNTRAIKNALCDYCGRRIALTHYGEQLRHHLNLEHERCFGVGSKCWTHPLAIGDSSGPQSKSPVRTHQRKKQKGFPITELAPARQFRARVGENWLNRWERKFEVKIPDENVKVLTRGKFVRRNEK